MPKENYIGWIKLHRSSFNNRMYFVETFTKWQAWCDLLLLANNSEGCFWVRGIKLLINRGQTGYSAVQLAKRWKWSRGKVIRFLDDLESEYQIVQHKNNATTLISIVNYNKFQDNDTPNGTTDSTANDTANDTPNGTANGTQTRSKEDKNNNLNINAGGGTPPPPPGLNLPQELAFYMPSDFNGLPEKWNESLIRFIKVTKKIEVEKDDVDSLWDIWKFNCLDGTKLYAGKEGVYRHFFNTSKNESFKKEQKPRAKKPTNDKIHGVEFLNNFSQCRMSDGSIQNLDANQTDSAKFNLINPNVIVKN